MRALCVLSCIVLLFSLSACASGGNTSSLETITTSSSQQEPAQIENPPDEPLSIPDSEARPDDAGEPSEEAQTTQITLTVGEIVITAELDHSDTAKEFIATLPRTLTMNRYDDREYYCLIEAITENGEAIDDFTNGDVTYYPVGPSFAVFFAGEERSDQGGLIRMGKITSDLSAFDALSDTIEVQIDLA